MSAVVGRQSPPRPALSLGRRLADARALPGVFVALSVMAILVAHPSDLLFDPDSQWHVAVGAWIWSHGAVPRTDLFSHTFAGSPWIAKEWLSQVALFVAHAVGGWKGVAVLASAAFAAAMGWLYAWLARRVRWSIALLAMLAVAVLYAPHLSARPHILVLPVVVVWMTGILGALDEDRAPPLWLAVAMAMWANMHGSFPLGLVVAGILACEGIAICQPGRRAEALRAWGVFLTVSAVATMASPFGWRAILVPLQMSGNADTLRFVDEWHPLRCDGYGVSAVAAMALVFAVLATDVRRNLFRIVAAACLAYLMVRHVRFISVAALVGVILAAAPLGRLAPAEALPRVLRRALPAATVAMALVVLGAAALRPARLDPQVTPDDAYQAALAHGVRGPVYNAYDFGGFLIAHGVPTFVDGRTDQLFLHGFLGDLVAALDAKDDRPFSELLRRHGVTWALVKPISKDARHLTRMAGWSKLYEDADAAVFVTDAR